MSALHQPNQPIIQKRVVNPKTIIATSADKVGLDAPNDKMTLDLITSSISVCITTGKTTMDQQVTEAARRYYLSIVDDSDASMEQKRDRIYRDLVIGTKANLFAQTDSSSSSSSSASNRKLSYVEDEKSVVSVTCRIGLSSDVIHRVSGDVLCVGQYKESDIYVPSTHVSRIHAFIFRIDDKLIVLDGWSKCGTQTIAVASNHSDDENEEEDGKQTSDDDDDEADANTNTNTKVLISSMPDSRNILQFNAHDIVHLRVGDAPWASDLVLNPKTCVVCAEKARVVRLACGHQILCHECYATLQQQTMSVAKCPLCRAPITETLPLTVSAGLKTFAGAASE